MTPSRSGLLAAALLLSFGSAILIQIKRDAAYPRGVRETAVLYVRSGPAMRRLALEFDALAADVYWIRAIQHYGGERLAKGRARNYDLLHPLLDIATSLDPYFTIAYRFGAIFLSEGYPGGPGRPDQAIALLRKGIAAQPDKWQYYHDIAFVQYWHLTDYKAAAEWFQKASERPGAPNWLAPLVPAMLNAGGDRSSARLLWEQILKSDQAWLRSSAARALRQLDALDVIDQLELRIQQVRLAPGEQYTWQLLVRRQVVPGIPLDPTGTPYDLDSADGRVRVAPESDLQPMPGVSRQKPQQ